MLSLKTLLAGTGWPASGEFSVVRDLFSYDQQAPGTLSLRDRFEMIDARISTGSPVLADILTAHPKTLGRAVSWFHPDKPLFGSRPSATGEPSSNQDLVPLPYTAWGLDALLELQEAFEKAWSAVPTYLQDPPINHADPVQCYSWVKGRGLHYYPTTFLDEETAWAWYKAMVSQSLAIELSGLVSWSLLDFPLEWLLGILSADHMFEPAQTNQGRRFVPVIPVTGYPCLNNPPDHCTSPHDDTCFEGWTTPADPGLLFTFIIANGLFQQGDRRLDVVGRLLNWCAISLVHSCYPASWFRAPIPSGETCNDCLPYNDPSSMEYTLEATPQVFEAQFNYLGQPPVRATICGTEISDGTELPKDEDQLGCPCNPARTYIPSQCPPRDEPSHRTYGCGGTVEFIMGVLRTLNIPCLKYKVTNATPPAEHIQAAFLLENENSSNSDNEVLYLSHGDEPYECGYWWARNLAAAPETPGYRMLVSASDFSFLFGAWNSRSRRGMHVGAGKFVWMTRNPPAWLIREYCQAMAEDNDEDAAWDKTMSFFIDHHSSISWEEAKDIINKNELDYFQGLDRTDIEILDAFSHLKNAAQPFLQSWESLPAFNDTDIPYTEGPPSLPPQTAP